LRRGVEHAVPPPRADALARVQPARDVALVRVFDAAPQDSRGMPAKKPVADYFL